MFSSLASFIFGSKTNCETQSTAATDTATDTGVKSDKSPYLSYNLEDTGNLIEVTSLTPSVAGAFQRPKNRRNNARQQNKRKGIRNSANQTKQLIRTESCDEGHLTEDEWCFVEKEAGEEKDDSPTPDDFEVELDNTTTEPISGIVVTTSLTQLQPLQHIDSQFPFIGPRPQKQRNYLKKPHNKTNNRSAKGLSVSTLSPSRAVNDGRNGSGQKDTADGDMTRSLYVAPTAIQQSDEEEPCNKMEESWFITPPPCFTSDAPLIMETSPYENLLIEHPSMSVYHSIKTQEASKKFKKLNIGTSGEMAEKQKAKDTSNMKKENQACNTRSGIILDLQSAAQLKQELMARSAKKIQNKRERKDLCRTAIQRANKVYNVQSRNHTQRRSDRQHSNIISNANNNRKCNCY